MIIYDVVFISAKNPNSREVHISLQGPPVCGGCIHIEDTGDFG